MLFDEMFNHYNDGFKDVYYGYKEKLINKQNPLNFLIEIDNIRTFNIKKTANKTLTIELRGKFNIPNFVFMSKIYAEKTILNLEELGLRPYQSNIVIFHDEIPTLKINNNFTTELAIPKNYYSVQLSSTCLQLCLDSESENTKNFCEFFHLSMIDKTPINLSFYIQKFSHQRSIAEMVSELNYSNIAKENIFKKSTQYYRDHYKGSHSIKYHSDDIKSKIRKKLLEKKINENNRKIMETIIESENPSSELIKNIQLMAEIFNPNKKDNIQDINNLYLTLNFFGLVPRMHNNGGRYKFSATIQKNIKNLHQLTMK